MRMPVFSYFTVAGSALLALLFLADARLKPQDNWARNNEFYGLPEKPVAPAQGSILVGTPAPAPDMRSEPVRIAAADVDAPLASTNMQIANIELPRSKPMRVAARVKPRHIPQTFAWNRHVDGVSPFGGSVPFFARF